MARDFTKLHPHVQALGEEFIRRCAKEGLKIKITDCVRSKAEQDALYAKGRTAPGSIVTNARYLFSPHNWGIAFDICRNDGKGAYNDEGNFFNRVGKIGESLGFDWGGSWKGFVDRPHYQFDGFMDGVNKIELMIQRYGTPERFFKHADFKVSTPTLDITPKSSKKKIIWLQVRLNIHGYKTDIDGIWGNQTIENVKKYWKKVTGNSCTGKRVSKRCIDLLAAKPE